MAAIRKVTISTGMYWVEVRGADVRILCGCPEDAVKHLLRTGLIVGTGIKLAGALRSSPMGVPISIAFGIACFIAVALLRWPLVWVLLVLGAIACTWAYRRLAARIASGAEQ